MQNMSQVWVVHFMGKTASRKCTVRLRGYVVGFFACARAARMCCVSVSVSFQTS